MTAIPLFRLSDPDTSRQAAARSTQVALSLEQRVLDALQFRALTADSICKVLEIDVRNWPTCKTLLSRMRKAGKLVWTGETIGGQNVWTQSQNASPYPVKVAGDRL